MQAPRAWGRGLGGRGRAGGGTLPASPLPGDRRGRRERSQFPPEGPHRRGPEQPAVARLGPAEIWEHFLEASTGFRRTGRTWREA